MQFFSDRRYLLGFDVAGIACIAVCLGIGSSISHAQALRPLTVVIQQCQGASCRVTEGMQQGLTVLDVWGSAPQLSGSTVRLSITPSPGSELDSRSSGVMSDGKYTVSIPAYRFSAGRYTWVLSSRSMGGTVAQGAFLVNRGGASPAGPAERASGTAVGVWSGINGTSGTIELLPGGFYKYGGKRAGRYMVSGETITFAGVLSGWNRGRARYDGKVIEFEWTRRNGGRNYFVFAR